MRRIFIAITLFSVCLSFSFGQTASDSITIKEVFGGYQFFKGGEKVEVHRLGSAMESNELACKKFASAQSSYTIASILQFAGGFMVGWPIGTYLVDRENNKGRITRKEFNWVMVGIGAGLIVVSIPLSQSFNERTIKAVNIYNKGLQANSFQDNSELRLGLTGNGIGLTLIF